MGGNQLNPDEFERAFVHVVSKAAQSMGWNHSELARAAFGDRPTSAAKWRKIRNENHGRRQSVSLSEAVALSNALGASFPEFCFRVASTLRMAEVDEKNPDPNDGVA